MKECFLILDKGSGPNTVHPLMGQVTIGRSSDNTITLPNDAVSRNHARISLREGLWNLEDLDSANGIIFKGNNVEKTVLTSGDIFKIGIFTFRFIERDMPKMKDHLFKTISILSDTIAGQGLPVDGQGVAPWWSKQLQEAVSAIPFFAHLGESERQEMLDTGSLHIFNNGEMIIQEGSEGRSIYVILDGRVKVFKGDHQESGVEIAVLGASQFFGEKSFFSGKPSSISIVALDKALLIEFNFTSMQGLIQKYPPVETVILNYYKERLADSSDKP